MTDFKKKWAAYATLGPSAAIVSVARGAGIVDGYEFALPDNSVTGCEKFRLHVKAAMSNTGTLGITSDKCIYVYAYDTVVGATDLRPDKLTGNTAALAAVNVGKLRYLGAIPVAAINDAAVAQHFIFNNPGPKGGLFFVNACGAGPGPTAVITVTLQGEITGTK